MNKLFHVLLILSGTNSICQSISSLWEKWIRKTAGVNLGSTVTMTESEPLKLLFHDLFYRWGKKMRHCFVMVCRNEVPRLPVWEIFIEPHWPPGAATYLWVIIRAGLQLHGQYLSIFQDVCGMHMFSVRLPFLTVTESSSFVDDFRLWGMALAFPGIGISRSLR